MSDRKMVPPAPQKSPRTLPEEGSQVGRLYSVIDLGTVLMDGQFAKDKNGNPRYKREVMLTWELPESMHVFNEEKGKQPLVVSKTFTFSLGEKANLRKFLNGWRGKVMTDSEAVAFDILVLLGQPCLLNIAIEESRTGNMYATVLAASKLPKGMECPPAINPKIAYFIDDLDGGNYSKLPEWIQKKIQASEEWKNKDTAPRPAYTKSTDQPDDDAPPVRDDQADEYAAELERKANDPFA